MISDNFSHIVEIPKETYAVKIIFVQQAETQRVNVNYKQDNIRALNNTINNDIVIICIIIYC